MVDIIYTFIRETLLNNSQLAGAENLALLLTWAFMVIVFFLFIKLGLWAFNLFIPRIKRGRRG